MSKTLRLVKVVVQPHFVIDDGDSLTEVVAEPLTVNASEWSKFGDETFPQAMSALERQLCKDGPQS